MGEQNKPEQQAPASPARQEVGKWLTVWEHAQTIQKETGTGGHLIDWDSHFEISNHFARTVSTGLLNATVENLRSFLVLLEELEWLAGRLRSLVTETDPRLDGALLAAAEMLRDRLGLPPPDGVVDVRDMFPRLDDATERRLAEQDAVINYWAGFASARTQQIAVLREQVAELTTELTGCCPPAEQDVSLGGPSPEVARQRVNNGRLHSEAMQALSRLGRSDLSL